MFKSATNKSGLPTERHSLIEREDYREYRDFCIANKLPYINRRDEMISAYSMFWKVAGEVLVESTGGLYLDKLGYFFIWRIPRKLKLRQFRKGEPIATTFCHSTNQRVLAPVFVPKHTTALRQWSMDGRFSTTVKKNLVENIAKGYRYKTHINSLKSLIR